MKPLFSLFFICIMFCCCGSAEIGNSKDVNPATVYMSCFAANTESDSALFQVQFRFAGPDGTTLVLNPPAKIELDGNALKVDSNALEGAFYAIGGTVNQFAGKHTVTFTANDSSVYVNHFSFDTFGLAKPIPAKITLMNGLQLAFIRLKDTDRVWVHINDTAQGTHYIDTGLTVLNNTAFIAAKAFKKLNLAC